MYQDTNQTSKCWKCKHMRKSIYTIFENETLYNCWCKVVDITNEEECDKFEICDIPLK